MYEEKSEALRIGRKGHSGLSCQRVEVWSGQPGTPAGGQVVCFLPWLLSYARCRDAGLLPPEVSIVYEMPYAIVSPSPETSIEAVQVVVDDFLQLMQERKLDPANLTLAGLSIGNFAAIYLANLIGSRLWAIAAGDRGEVLIWTSSLAAAVRRQAEARGYSYWDFKAALRDFNPINNLRNIKAGSTFVAGYFDTIVPFRSSMNIVAEARNCNPSTRSVVLPFGHTATLFAGIQYLRLKNRKRYD